MGFFSELFGFVEGRKYTATQKALQDIATFSYAPPTATCGYWKEQCHFQVPNGKSIAAGIFSMPTVEELRLQVRHEIGLLQNKDGATVWKQSTITVQNMVGEARSLHSEPFAGILGKHQREDFPPENHYVFQAASQFNLLEFPHPRITPEAGIQNYIRDRTQGPACAVACAAGTAYRNYLVPMMNNKKENDKSSDVQQRGQTKDCQLNGMEPLEDFLKSSTSLLKVPWRVQNGYVESEKQDLVALNALLESDPQLHDKLVSKLQIGVQEDAAVTDTIRKECLVTQTYNSAISIGYSSAPNRLWEPIARIVLQASYEATLLVAMLKSMELAKQKPTTVTVLLTKVGGGVFQNDDSWICEAIGRAIHQVNSLVTEPLGMGLDIRIVHFGGVQEEYRLLEEWKDE